MKFTFLNVKTNKPMTEDEFERIIGVRSDCLYINKEGIGIALLDDGDMVPVCVEANSIIIVPKNTTNFKWVKRISKDKMPKTVGIHKGTRCYMCAFDAMNDCEMKCEEGLRKQLEQEAK